MFLISAPNFQIPTLIVVAVLGLLLGDKLGPLPTGVFDWEYGMPWKYVNAIKSYDGILLGGVTTAMTLAAGKLFRASSESVVLIVLVVALLFFLLEPLRAGEPLTIDVLIGRLSVMFPFVIGMFTAFGMFGLVQRLWDGRSRDETT